jgi:hypothetical protein
MQLEGRFLDRAGGELELPAHGPIGLRHHGEHMMFGRFCQGLKGGQADLAGSDEDDVHKVLELILK